MAKILLIEDDYVLANTLIDWLNFQGHDAEHVADGDLALERIEAGSHDILVLDWRLPGLSGIEICRRYREGGGEKPVLMLTGLQTGVEKEASEEAGATRYLAKPFQLEELSREVELLLKASIED